MPPRGMLDTLAARLGLTASSSAADVDEALANERVRSYMAARLQLDPAATGQDILAAVDDLKARAAARVAADEAAAEQRRNEAAQRALASTPPISTSSRGPAYARNPLVDRVHAEGKSSPAGTPPTLFASGDLPAATASGIAPQALLEVPWQARHAMAAAPTTAAAYAILEDCNGLDGELSAQLMYGAHDGNQEYAYRVEQWRLGSLSEAQLADSSAPGAPAEKIRRDHAAAEAFNRTLGGE